jgi:hypothetical protein
MSAPHESPRIWQLATRWVTSLGVALGGSSGTSVTGKLGVDKLGVERRRNNPRLQGVRPLAPLAESRTTRRLMS